MKVLIALTAFLAVAWALPAKQNALLKLTKSGQCAGTECPGGCCPEVDWYCCPDGMYCGATASDCPLVNKIQKLASLATKKSTKCDGTMCPGGCCPEQNWHCCPDGLYCGATAADCPPVGKVQKLASLATNNSKKCEGTVCPGGCCPEANWYCCPDGMYCGATASECPIVKKIQKLASLATKKTKQCAGTECPGGCCPELGWYCCPDGLYCGATASDCPLVNKVQKLVSMAATKSEQCPGTECPDGKCCLEQNWFCCPGNNNCAVEEAACPGLAIYQKILY